MKNKWIHPIWLLVIVLLVSNIGFAALLWRERRAPAKESEPENPLAWGNPGGLADLEELEIALPDDVPSAIAQKIISREVVPEPYINFSEDEEMKQDIEKYNWMTSDLRMHAEANIITALEDSFGLEITAENYLQQQPEIRYLVERIAQYSLYRNGAQLIDADPELSQMLHMEPAKSNGPWLDFIQNHTSIDRLGSADTLVYGLPEVDEYYTLTEALVTALFTDRQAIIKKVLSREVVEDAYFPCIDDPVLVDMIKQYNETTANFKMHYVEYLLPTVDDLFGLTGKEWAEAGKFNYFSRPEEVKAVMPRLTHYILYLTYGNMIKNDPLLSPLVIQANPNNVLLEPERLWAGGADGYTGYNLSDYCLLSNKIVQSLNN